MVDQLTSHGQLGVTMKVFTNKNNKITKLDQSIAHQPHIDYAGGSLLEADRIHDEDIFIACGATLGMALRDLAVGKRREYLVIAADKAFLAPTISATKSILTSSASSVFLCPLDEAFAEATLELELDLSTTKYTAADVATATAATKLFSCDLAPYGNIPPNLGRRWIGCYRCNLTPLFFEHLHQNLNNDTTHAKCNTKLHLQKVRGHNAHHVVESTFKSFARVFRACLDELTMMNGHQHHGCIRVGKENINRLLARRRAAQTQAELEEGNSNGMKNNTNNMEEEEKHRTGSRSRSTKETTIEVNVDLDRRASITCTTAATKISNTPDNDTIDISTGVEITDQLLMEIRECCGFHFNVHCKGDIYIDDHHTSEDVAITLGQCFNVALGDKAGLARMGCAEIAVGDNNGHTTTSNIITTVRCVMDLSNRPYFEWDLPLDEEYVGGDKEAFAAMRRGAVAMNNKKSSNNNNSANTNTTTATMLCGSALTCEMLQHIFESLTIETRATVHMEILQHHDNNNDETLSSSKKTNKYKPYPGHTKDLAFAAARAFGTALAECVRIDPRRAGKVASSKGTLSV